MTADRHSGLSFGKGRRDESKRRPISDTWTPVLAWPRRHLHLRFVIYLRENAFVEVIGKNVYWGYIDEWIQWTWLVDL